MEVSGQPHPPGALPSGIRTHWIGRLGGPQSRFGGSGEEKKSRNYLCQELNPSRPAYTLISVLTEIHQLLEKNRSIL